jgi:hypothetical protein
MKWQNSHGARFALKQLQTSLILSVIFIWSYPWVGLNGLWFELWSFETYEKVIFDGNMRDFLATCLKFIIVLSRISKTRKHKNILFSEWRARSYRRGKSSLTHLITKALNWHSWRGSQ